CSTDFASLQIHIHVRHAGRRVEGRQQAVAEVGGQVQQTLITGQLVTAQQTAQQPDGDLKILDFDVFVEGQVVHDQLASLVGFVGESHQDQRIESVYRSHQQRNTVPIAIATAQRLELIVTPGILLVSVPGVKKLGTHLLSHGCGFDSVRTHSYLRGRGGWPWVLASANGNDQSQAKNHCTPRSAHRAISPEKCSRQAYHNSARPAVCGKAGPPESPRSRVIADIAVIGRSILSTTKTNSCLMHHADGESNAWCSKLRSPDDAR